MDKAERGERFLFPYCDVQKDRLSAGFRYGEPNNVVSGVSRQPPRHRHPRHETPLIGKIGEQAKQRVVAQAVVSGKSVHPLVRLVPIQHVIARRDGDTAGLSLVRGNIAKYFVAMREIEQAKQAAFDALLLSQQSPDPATIAMAVNDAPAAACLLGAADALLDIAQRHRVLFAGADYERIQTAISERMSAEDALAAADTGSSWTLSEMISAATSV